MTSSPGPAMRSSIDAAGELLLGGGDVGVAGAPEDVARRDRDAEGHGGEGLGAASREEDVGVGEGGGRSRGTRSPRHRRPEEMKNEGVRTNAQGWM